MSQNLLARIIAFPINGSVVSPNAVGDITNDFVIDESFVVCEMQLVDGTKNVIVDIDGPVSSFFSCGDVVDAIAARAGCNVMMILQEGVIIPHYNFVFNDSFPHDASMKAMGDFYAYVYKELTANHADNTVQLRASW